MASASFFFTYHRWNALLCTPIGFLLNLLLLWLILRRTPKDMWVFSRVLLQTCIFDMLMLLSLALGGHTMVVNQPWGYFVFFQGYLLDFYQSLWADELRHTALLILDVSSLGIFYLDTYSISAQFLYRYLDLNRDIKVGIGRYLLFLLLPFLVNLALFSTLPLVFIEKDLDDLERALSSHGLMDMEEKPVYVTYGAPWSAFFPYWTAALMLSHIFFYSIIIFCGIRMVRLLSAHAMNPRLKELNRQLSRNLIILAAFPFVMSLGIGLFMIITGFMSNDLFLDIQLLLSPLIFWLSVVNPLISIWTFRPYREALLKAICCCKFKITPVQNENGIT